MDCHYDYMPFSFCLFFFFHYVDLKGEINDLGTVPHQETILAPKSSLFAFFNIYI